MTLYEVRKCQMAQSGDRSSVQAFTGRDVKSLSPS